MADYHFLTTYQIEAPIEQVWQALRDFDHYPTWSKGIFHAQRLQSGPADGVGDKIRYRVKGRLPFTLAFDATVAQADPPRTLELRAFGELEGVGRWMLSQHGTITTAQYTWDVRTNKRWMNLLAPLARPIFEWNHDGVMRDAGYGLARFLGARLISIQVGSRRSSKSPARLTGTGAGRPERERRTS
jgi:Polyketide cyclase / dehydrase and lipid transport